MSYRSKCACLRSMGWSSWSFSSCHQEWDRVDHWSSSAEAGTHLVATIRQDSYEWPNEGRVRNHLSWEQVYCQEWHLAQTQRALAHQEAGNADLHWCTYWGTQSRSKSLQRRPYWALWRYQLLLVRDPDLLDLRAPYWIQYGSSQDFLSFALDESV